MMGLLLRIIYLSKSKYSISRIILDNQEREMGECVRVSESEEAESGVINN